MWNYQLYSKDKDQLKRFAKYSLIIGIIFTILGVLSIVYPFYAAFSIAALVSWLMVVGGLMVGYFTFITDPKDWIGWLKSLVLLVIGLLIIFYPINGVETVGILFAIYLIFDGFASFVLGSTRKPAKGWWLWIVNGFISIVLSVIFLVSWPFIPEEMWLIGIYVGISLLVDGLVLIFIGASAEKTAFE